MYSTAMQNLFRAHPFGLFTKKDVALQHIHPLPDDWQVLTHYIQGEIIPKENRNEKMDIYIDTDEMKQKLTQQKQVLTQQIKEEKRKASPTEMTNPDRNDLAADYALRDRRTSLLEQLTNQHAEVEDALARINDGSYGFCTSCGKPILPERLAVLNYAKLCIECQRIENEN
jgi:RNA polymerase-binding transcription factor DksA